MNSSSYKSLPPRIAGLSREKKDLKGLFEEVVSALRESFDHYDWVGIYLVEGENLILRSFRGDPTQHTRIRVGEGVCGWAAKTGETTVVPDVREDKRYLMCFPGTRSEIVVPIQGKNGVLGEIDIDSSRISAFTEVDSRMLEEIASHLAEAIESELEGGEYK